jgi:arylsulfatase A-like enzyme
MRLSPTTLAAVLLTPLVALHAAEESAARPNILILIADDLGYADLGVQGCRDFPTPHLDSVAASGLRFTSGYVSGPVCSPSRAGLMTGRYQTRFGHEFNHPLADRAPVGLPDTVKTAAQLFRDAGYLTGHVGKWHLGNPKLAHLNPRARGFDESVWFGGQRKLPPLLFYRDGKPDKADDRYVDEAIAREAASFITRNRIEPWFLYVAFLTPHQPLDTPPGTEAPFEALADAERRKCAAMMSLLDGGVGRILQALRASGQDERTLVIFLSDNGAPPRNGSRNTPLRGTKGTTWEGGIRVPLLMRWKGVLPEGRVVDAPVISLDLLPTALAAAGVVPPGDPGFDGVNLLPLLTGRTSRPPQRALFWRYGQQMAVRQGDWKLTRAIEPASRPPVLKTGLYHLGQDIGEQHDLSARESERLKRLESLWKAWDAENVPALWGGNAEDGQRGDAAPARVGPTLGVEIDHKADYRGESIYPEVAALRQLVARWSGGKPDVTFDLPSPVLNTRVISTHALRTDGDLEEGAIAARTRRSEAPHFLQVLERVQTGPLPCRVVDSLEFAVRKATVPEVAGLAERLQNEKGPAPDPRVRSSPVPITVGFEVPYAVVGQTEVTPDSARALGRDLARALRVYLDGRGSTP